MLCYMLVISQFIENTAFFYTANKNCRKTLVYSEPFALSYHILSLVLTDDESIINYRYNTNKHRLVL